MGGREQHVQFSPMEHNLDPLPPVITVNGAGKNSDGLQPTNTLVLNDQRHTESSVVWAITGSPTQPGSGKVSRFVPTKLGEITLQPLVAHEHQPANQDLQTVHSDRERGVTGQHLQLSPTVENLDELPLNMEINGGSSANALVANDQLDPLVNIWKIDGATMTRTHGSEPGGTTNVARTSAVL